MVLVSIIISVHNKFDDLQKTIESIRKTTNINLEIIVVSAASNDNTDEIIPEEFPEVRLIKAPDIGWGEANNLGAMDAKGDFFFFSGADIEFMEQWLEKLVNCSKNIKNLGSIGTIVNRIEHGRNKYTGGIILRAGGIWNLFYEPEKKDNNLNNKYKHDNCMFYSVDSVLYPFIKRETFLKSGGFDPDYFYWEDDVDLGLRLKKMGLNNFIINFYGMKTDASEWSKKTTYYWNRNRLRLILKVNEFPINFLFGFGAILDSMRAATIHLMKGEYEMFHIILSAIIWNLKSLKYTIKSKKSFFQKNLVSQIQ